jgi:N-acetylmuramoyl-L-alanine amidase
MAERGLPVARGDTGAAVSDVQSRLRLLGHAADGDPGGEFGAGTEAAVRAFQTSRGLRSDGICGPQTWNALVEAGFRLGDRMLYHRQPMLRGDDVATLQRRLSALGFDTGRVDGIFGPHTAAALEDFQRNAGLVVDGTCGRDTLDALTKLGSRPDTSPVLADVREREALRGSPRTLLARRVAVGEQGGLAALADAVGKARGRQGATVVVLHEPDESTQALNANDANAELYVGLVLAKEAGVTTSYFSHLATGAASSAGERLAHEVQAAAVEVLGEGDRGVHGMSLPILRETRMPAVVCEFGPPSSVVLRSGELAQALTAAVGRWVADPCD